MYKNLFQPLLFTLPPEKVHDLTINLLSFAGRIPLIRNSLANYFTPKIQHPTHLLGFDFSNPIGLAAGYDKDGIAIPGLAALGFGHIEIGTITPLPQLGNPKPRVFRLLEDKAIINRMGFPSKGYHQVIKNIKSIKKHGSILGINIGKNKNTPLAESHNDYTQLIDSFSPYADYFTINISSPNTKGLRDLQHKVYLEQLLTKICDARDQAAEITEKHLPLLVKLSPDLEIPELDQAIETILSSKIDGVIATNTTISRPSLVSQNKTETGGLSGIPLRNLSTEMIAYIHRQTNGALPIVGVGGIFNAQDAQEKLDAGASLVQIYTGLIYQGPALVKNIIENLY